ncbi:GBS Bsp-like repeat-containing protein, partial [Thomasclavelia ramosa]|uniref:GBS Bsp-like repeat-containing protein n=2 Tax=Thomasclavelia ramosa TaxID=1547 RepID=UPI0018A8F0F9
NVKISNVTKNGYTVTATVTDDTKLDKVLFGTWTTKNGQDDMVWQPGTISGNTVTYTVKTSDHNKESGEYRTVLYAYDNEGLLTTTGAYVTNVPKVNEAPKISNVKISNVTKNGYTVTATVTDDTKLDKVLFGTWTTKNGQDDMVWQPGTISGNTVTYTVKTSDHNKESGEYRTVLYAYDNEGLLTTTGAYVTNIPAQNKAPQISNVVVKDITSTSYKIECKVTDDLKVDRVLFGTWTTKNGQDDMIWQPGTIDGDTVTYTVSRDNHNFEYGTYNTHIYAYDEEDGLSIHANNGIKIEKPSNYSIPLIYDVYISDLNEDGYTITCQVESNKNISQVLFGTWTMYGGQDDMVWQPGKIEGNTVTYRVNRSQHNFEYGAYKTAIYAYDGEGNLASVITPIQNVKNSSAKSGWLEDANHKYFYDGYGQLVGNGPSKKVIDVSKWNYDIDWQTVKDSGDVDGVIIRIKNGQKLEEDPYFWKNYSECKRLGIPVGLYIYSYAGNGNQALEEANYVINTLNKRGITPNDLAYPVFLDLEGEYATATAQQYVDIVEQFVDRINSYGFDAKVYSYRSYLNSVLNNPKIWKHVSWVAAYTDSLGFNNPYYNGVKGWQYTSSGYVPGISTSVDINCWYEE